MIVYAISYQEVGGEPIRIAAFQTRGLALQFLDAAYGEKPLISGHPVETIEDLRHLSWTICTRLYNHWAEWPMTFPSPRASREGLFRLINEKFSNLKPAGEVYE